MIFVINLVSQEASGFGDTTAQDVSNMLMPTISTSFIKVVTSDEIEGNIRCR